MESFDLALKESKPKSQKGGKQVRNLFLMIAMSGLFYTTLSGTLYDMTVADCNAGVAAACEEIAK